MTRFSLRRRHTPPSISVHSLGKTACLLGCLVAAPAYPSVSKNVILMIADGASWGTWDMAAYWEYGALGEQPYDGFEVKLGKTTYPLNTSLTPTGDPTPLLSYDPNQAWSQTPNGGTYVGTPNLFDGYRYIKDESTVTDSAASATAMASGVKTYLGALNYDNFGQPVEFITQTAKGLGKATGVVTSVPFTHATPAAFGAQNLSRDNFGEIGKQMVNDPTLDLIMGTGNPLYDNDGRLRTTPQFAAETGAGGGFIAQSTWDALSGPSAPMQLIQSASDFAAMANGTWLPDGRVIGLPTVYQSLQYNRTAAVQGSAPANPTGVAYNPNVPTLTTMTSAALNYLGRDPDGMFLMIEGGAVDWGAHANNTVGTIEEMIDFNWAVQAVMDWVGTNSTWQETLLIVTTDHGNGMPMGPQSDTVAFQPIQNNGVGVLPGVRWNWGSHTNENTLLYATGTGAEGFADHIVGTDPFLTSILAFNDGLYIDNPAVYDVMRTAIAPAAAPLPPPFLLILGALPMLVRHRRRPASHLSEALPTLH